MWPPGVPTWPRVTANAPLIDYYEDYQAESQRLETASSINNAISIVQ